MHRSRLELPADTLGSTLPTLTRLGALPDADRRRGVLPDRGRDASGARAPAGQQLPGLTRGEGVLESTFDHHQPVRGRLPSRPRTDDDPLNRKAYLAKVDGRRAGNRAADPLRPTVVMRLGVVLGGAGPHGLGLRVDEPRQVDRGRSGEGAGRPRRRRQRPRRPQVRPCRESAAPPPFRLRYDDQELATAPYAVPLRDGCADGMAGRSGPSGIGSPPRSGSRAGEGLGRSPPPLSAADEAGRTGTVEPDRGRRAGTCCARSGPGSYHVDLFGQGRRRHGGEVRLDDPR